MKRSLVACAILAACGPWQAEAAEPVHFVEVIYEIDIEPLADRLPPVAESARLPNGYVVHDVGAAVPVTLFPASGGPAFDAGRTGVVAGLWFRSPLLSETDDMRVLRAVDSLPYVPDLGSPDDPLPDLAIELTPGEEAVVRAVADGQSVEIAPRSWAQVAIASRAFARDEVPATMARELDWLVGRDELVTIYARLLVVNHGMAALADHDLLSTWRAARRAALTGPYDEALALLESLLDVLPGHGGAGRLFSEVFDLVETGAEPANVSGRLAFPEGQPDAATRAVWEMHDPGYVTLLSGPDAAVQVERTVLVENGSFSADVPAGTYRLSVAVPGFRTVDMDVRAAGKTAIDVPLEIHE